MARDHYKLAELIHAISAYEPTQRHAPVKASLNARVRIGGSGTFLAQRQQDKSPTAKRYVIDSLETALARQADPYRQLLLHNVLMRVDLTYDRFLKAARALKRADLSLAERHATWYTLYVHRFSNMPSFSPSQWLKTGYLLRALYQRIVAEARMIYGPACAAVLARAPAQSATPHYAIALSEFLDDTHPLVKQAIDLGKALMRHEGAKISVLNASIPPRLPVSYFGDHTLACILKKLNGVSSICYGNAQFDFAQNPNMIMNAQSFAWYAQQMSQLNPTGVITIGPGNVLADTLAPMLPTIAFPNIGEVPLSAAPVQCTVAAPSPAQRRLNARAGTPQTHVHQIPTAFRLPENAGRRNRSSFGFKDTARIALIVGMRLETECSDAFLSILNAAAQRHDDLHFVFAGPVMRRQAWLRAYPALKGKANLLGYREDILAITRACDLYINPVRQGGGTSAVYALSAGLPVISTAQGDVAEIMGHTQCAQTQDDLAPLLDNCLTDDRCFSALKAHCDQRWKEKSDMSQMAKAVAALLRGCAETQFETQPPSRVQNDVRAA